MLSDLTDQRFLVAGAANGLGRATAELLVERAARVLLADLDETRLAGVRATSARRRGLSTVTSQTKRTRSRRSRRRRMSWADWTWPSTTPLSKQSMWRVQQAMWWRCDAQPNTQHGQSSTLRHYRPTFSSERSSFCTGSTFVVDGGISASLVRDATTTQKFWFFAASANDR